MPVIGTSNKIRAGTHWKGFAQEAELAEKPERLSALNALLNRDEKGDEALGMDDAPIAELARA